MDHQTDVKYLGQRGPRGTELHREADGTLYVWARCHQPACPNMVCSWLSRTLCYPHAINYEGALSAQRSLVCG